MPMDFLMKIQDECFPLIVTEPSQINSAAVLLAAGMIEGTVPPPERNGEALAQPPAVIASITALGRAEIAKRITAPPGP